MGLAKEQLFQNMGTEYPNSPAIPLRPASPFSVPQSSTPFKSSGPVVGPEASAFGHAPPSSSQITPSSSSGAMVGVEASAFRTIPSGMPNGAARPPPTSGSPNMPPAAGPYQ
ncbi:hypothetical protein RND71_019406 [Anisodus tanguticus]|uniref:Uncharacterized protein n=1 Tax=Anisodus tanguticus TaxID=243964 RepID=A0AAE1S049_9SOLA|nr:hypothetical protein RND71_019406 [Anisodus tanguticus]